MSERDEETIQEHQEKLDFLCQEIKFPFVEWPDPWGEEHPHPSFRCLTVDPSSIDLMSSHWHVQEIDTTPLKESYEVDLQEEGLRPAPFLKDSSSTSISNRLTKRTTFTAPKLQMGYAADCGDWISIDFRISKNGVNTHRTIESVLGRNNSYLRINVETELGALECTLYEGKKSTEYKAYMDYNPTSMVQEKRVEDEEVSKEDEGWHILSSDNWMSCKDLHWSDSQKRYLLRHL